MGITRKPSGRFIVGLGASDLNEYKEVGALKDLFIQLTSDGCTDESQNYLNYLADYAEYHSGLGEPIMPPGVNVWLSNNGTTTAVEADDLSLEDGTYTICGITCTDGEWDFSNAGQQGGGGGSDLPEVDDSDNGKVLTVVEGAWSAASASGGSGLLEVANPQSGKYTLDGKSYNDVRALLLQGIVPIAHYTVDDNVFPEFSLLDEIQYNGVYYSVSFKNTFFFESETTDGALQYVMD